MQGVGRAALCLLGAVGRCALSVLFRLGFHRLKLMGHKIARSSQKLPELPETRLKSDFRDKLWQEIIGPGSHCSSFALLRKLALNDNQLQRLPDSFGELNKLERLGS